MSVTVLFLVFVNQSQSAASAVTSVVMKSAVAASRVGDIIQGGKKLAKESKKFEPWKAGVVNSGVGAMNSKRGGLDGAEEVDGGGGLLTRREKATTISSSVMSLEVSPDEKMYPDEVLVSCWKLI